MFQSAGRIWGFWNIAKIAPHRASQPLFQSAGRIWGFWNATIATKGVLYGACFNPPGGFGAFGTAVMIVLIRVALRFQSAGRIWGFWNVGRGRSDRRQRSVSIRRADLGLLELASGVAW
ncbi:hypothetical protein OSCT_0331 [Oscillochloris trichoides DG-6]|uniref:Uncharacterized protein n=1 Tax=Oscillochloris trichoides DG-6 TaxID=765420 RepID=E1IAI0_9CHLR|nr:hypothetical protein OSCT_0331 [Oscillochloris trichoides DG-6]